MLSDHDPDHLRRLLEAASPRPWRVGNVETYHVFVPCSTCLGPERVLLRMNEHFPFEADAALIVAAVNALPALLARVAELEAALGEAIGVLSLCDVRGFPAPEDAEVRAFCERLGFGAVMSAAAKTWCDMLTEAGAPSGGAYTCGPCVATVTDTLARLRAVAGKGVGGG